MNEEMTHVEVLAVEIKQFQHADGVGQKALVPRVVGLTEAARSAKRTIREREDHITSEQFLARCAPGTRDFFQKAVALAEERGHFIYWGTVGFSIRAYSPQGVKVSFAYGYPPSLFQFYFADLAKKLEISPEALSELRGKLLEYGVFSESGGWTLSAKLTEDILTKMEKVYEFVLDQIDELIKSQ